MTYGILESALQGLAVAAGTYDAGGVADGVSGQRWEVRGGGGLLDGDGRCYYQVEAGGTKGCQEVANGAVKGFD